jgi:hypothetical protein
MNRPEAPTPYRTRPAAALADPTAPLAWLLRDLFLVGAAGVLGGAPKTGKSFFALELAVAVASATIAAVGPRLLILDPLIRLHRADENSAAEMAVILDGLRTLARASACAILLVHHTRKAPAGGIPGHGLRGSSDLHAFGDTNLYLRRVGPDVALELRIEHRAAPGPPPLRLQLETAVTPAGPTARFVCPDAPPADPLRERTLTLLHRASGPLTTDGLRAALGVRKQTLLALLQHLAGENLIRRAGREGWTVDRDSVPVPDPIGGNRN